MIKLLLSLAVAAFSGVSSFVGSPKKTTSEGGERQYSLYFSWEWSNDLGPNNNAGGFRFNAWYGQNSYFSGDSYYVSGDEDIPFDETLEGGYHGTFNYSNFDYEEVYFTLYFDCPISFANATPEFGFTGNEEHPNTTTWTLSTDQDGDTTIYYLSSPEFYSSYGSQPFERGDGNCSVTIYYGNPRSYNLTKNYINCDIASSPVLPNTYTADNQLSYYVLMVSAAGGYGFTAQSVTQTGGITIRNFNLFDQYNNSGYYASCSFNVDLPFNDCSITIQAFLPSYIITANLERCTVSPSIPSSYTGTSFSGDYTFTAVSGYGFNKNYTHWEVTNLFIDSVEFSALLWGSFYSSVTLHLRASGGNSSISVTAIEYDEENYKLGYEEGREDGWQAGYDRGHDDGEIAGDSYGVWNWLKQAALTTGEFFNIPLLPGFSIGGLLTALAGLVIIWFFVKGFLFKS